MCDMAFGVIALSYIPLLSIDVKLSFLVSTQDYPSRSFIHSMDSNLKINQSSAHG